MTHDAWIAWIVLLAIGVGLLMLFSGKRSDDDAFNFVERLSGKRWPAAPLSLEERFAIWNWRYFTTGRGRHPHPGFKFKNGKKLRDYRIGSEQTSSACAEASEAESEPPVEERTAADGVEQGDASAPHASD